MAEVTGTTMVTVRSQPNPSPGVLEFTRLSNALDLARQGNDEWRIKEATAALLLHYKQCSLEDRNAIDFSLSEALGDEAINAQRQVTSGRADQLLGWGHRVADSLRSIAGMTSKAVPAVINISTSTAELILGLLAAVPVAAYRVWQSATGHGGKDSPKALPAIS